MKKCNYTKVIDSHLVKDVDRLSANFTSGEHIFVAPVCSIQKGGYLILDFGKEICGRVHVVFGFSENSKIRIRTGESVDETCAELNEKNAGNHHSLRDAVYPVVFWSDFSTSETGFRFVRIDVLGEEKVDITSIYAEESENGLTKRGSFLSSDKRLNDIYEVASRTIELCVRPDAIWDGVKRDRVAWIGDFYPELLSAHLIYGNIPQMERMLDYVSSFEGKWVNSIPAYSAWWIVCFEKYYQLSGNEAYLQKMLHYLKDIVKEFSKIIFPGGKVSFANSTLGFFDGNELFLDWPTHTTPDAEIGWRYLLLYAMKRASVLLSSLGEDTSLADNIVKNLNEYSYPVSSFKQVTALGVLAGKIDPKEAAPLLKKGGAKGMTCFLSFAIVEALSLANEGEEALNLIKEYYGAMLDLGATTFWEDFDVDWLNDHPDGVSALPNVKRKNIHADYGKFCYLGLRHSLCHGWSTGFLDFYASYLLGVFAIEPGYKSIKVEPHLCGLSFVEGTIPTPYGDIWVRHENKKGQIETCLKCPEGIVVK